MKVYKLALEQWEIADRTTYGEWESALRDLGIEDIHSHRLQGLIECAMGWAYGYGWDDALEAPMSWGSSRC